MKWISVEGEMPEEINSQYICYCVHKNGDLVIALIWDGEGWGEEGDDDTEWCQFVTHWMPLPQPPTIKT